MPFQGVDGHIEPAESIGALRLAIAPLADFLAAWLPRWLARWLAGWLNLGGWLVPFPC